MQGFQAVAVHKAPHVTLPVFHLADPPEEHPAVILVFRYHHADDPEVAARPKAFFVRDRQAHPVGAAAAELYPVKVHADLAILLKDETAVGRLQRHIRLAIPFRH
ncbi:hypothetical protein D3C78_923000 [compost metagenome]